VVVGAGAYGGRVSGQARKKGRWRNRSKEGVVRRNQCFERGGPVDEDRARPERDILPQVCNIVHGVQPDLTDTLLYSRKIVPHYRALFPAMREPHVLISPLYALLVVCLTSLLGTLGQYSPNCVISRPKVWMLDLPNIKQDCPTSFHVQWHFEHASESWLEFIVTYGSEAQAQFSFYYKPVRDVKRIEL
jgi:hypothetical protein